MTWNAHRRVVVTTMLHYPLPHEVPLAAPLTSYLLNIRLMGPASEPRNQSTDIAAIVARLSTLFSTMQDFPVIR